MKFLPLFCVLLQRLTSVGAATQELITHKIEIRLLNLIGCPICKQEDRRLDGADKCDFKLKLRDVNSVEGEEGSIRIQSELGRNTKIRHSVIRSVRRISTTEKVIITVDIYDYDQTNYHPDRLLGHFSIDLSDKVEQTIDLDTNCTNKEKSAVCIKIIRALNVEDKVASNWSVQMQIYVKKSIIKPDNTRTCNVSSWCSAMRNITSYVVYPDNKIRCNDSDSTIDFGTTSEGDFNGDGICDAVCWNKRTQNTVWAVGAKTLLFKKPMRGETLGVFCVTDSDIEVRDVTGDGRDDLICTATNDSILSSIDGLISIDPNRNSIEISEQVCDASSTCIVMLGLYYVLQLTPLSRHESFFFTLGTFGAKYCYPKRVFMGESYSKEEKLLDNEGKCVEYCSNLPGRVGGSYQILKNMCRCNFFLSGEGSKLDDTNSFAFASNTRTYNNSISCGAMRSITNYFVSPVNSIRCFESDSEIDFGDFSGDGICDVVCWNKRTQQTQWALGVRTFGFMVPSQGESVGSFCIADSKIHVHDVNGDGKDDLVCTGTNQSMLSGMDGLNSMLVDTSWPIFLSEQLCDSPNVPKYKGTLKLNVLSKYKDYGTIYFKIADDLNVIPKTEFDITFDQTDRFKYEAMYSEDFVSYVKKTIVRVSSMRDKESYWNTISLPLDFGRIDSAHEHLLHYVEHAEIYIQVRGTSKRIIDISRDCLYTAKVTLESFTLDGEVDGVYPWIRITASSPMTGERTIFENSFFTRHPEMREEDKILFTNGTLTGFPEGELDNVSICVLLAVYVDHVNFLIDGYHSKMNKFPHPFCMSNFIVEKTESECPTAMAISTNEKRTTSLTSITSPSSAILSDGVISSTTTPSSSDNMTKGHTMANTPEPAVVSNNNIVYLVVLICTVLFGSGFVVFEIKLCRNLYSRTKQFPWLKLNRMKTKDGPTQIGLEKITTGSISCESSDTQIIQINKEDRCGL